MVTLGLKTVSLKRKKKKKANISKEMARIVCIQRLNILTFIQNEGKVAGHYECWVLVKSFPSLTFIKQQDELGLPRHKALSTSPSCYSSPFLITNPFVSGTGI